MYNITTIKQSLNEKYNSFKSIYQGRSGAAANVDIKHPHLFGVYSIIYPDKTYEFVNSIMSTEAENHMIDFINKRNNDSKAFKEANCILRQEKLDNGIIITYVESKNDIDKDEMLLFTREDHRDLDIVMIELKNSKDINSQFGLSESTNPNKNTTLNYPDIKCLIKRSLEGLREAVNGSDVEPVFVFLSTTETKISKTIRNFTGDPYSHASIAFDYKLDSMYSFLIGPDENKLLSHGGFKKENITDPFYKEAGSKYSLYVAFLDKCQIESMKTRLNDFLNNPKKYSFNKIGIVLNAFGITTEFEHSFFCSEFVAEILNASGIQMVNQHRSRIRPYDLAKLKTFHFLDKGKVSNYNSDRVKKKLDSLHNQLYGEESLSEYVNIILENRDND